MEGQRQQRLGGSNRRRRRKKKNEPKAKAEPVTIVARRPDSPRLFKVSGRNIAASAQPKAIRGGGTDKDEAPAALSAREKPRRAARILASTPSPLSEDEMRAQRLISRLLLSEGRGAITTAADALLENGIDIPQEQEAQLQLLEHKDERHAASAIDVIARLLEVEAPIKRPILDQRLRRLEDEAESTETRSRAAALRRTIRVA